ncbi:DmpA family aminopeptidase [Brevibacillus daliensis]|uniref:DmpA family aminopeptidase n=1 Tax=Brevibacillus daliensis TaxID=2892995 RepID=UPI001E443653|nr:P1 family peptidase [Brevibacillus daliensis]
MKRYRLRELGIQIGKYQTGPNNSITDVEGVLVGHQTLHYDTENGDAVRTGVTAILPHAGNLFKEKVRGTSHVINGFGKTIGTIQLQEIGVIESPIMLTNTLSVPAVAQGTIRYLLDQNPEIGDTTGTVNVLVGECNDGFLNDIRGMHVQPSDAVIAIQNAKGEKIEEGSVGAGTGMSCFGYKGGIGTSSRVISYDENSFTIGALVLSNYGGPEEHLPLRRPRITNITETMAKDHSHIQTEEEKVPDGSIMIILATNAPVHNGQLERIAKRATFGLARTGSYAANGSGDIVLAFTTANKVSHFVNETVTATSYLAEKGEIMSDLFEMTADVVEEAIWNSLCQATTVKGRSGKIKEAIPYDYL